MGPHSYRSTAPERGAAAVAALLAGILSALLYGATAVPGSYWDDGGEMVAVAIRRGILHPPGHAFPALLFGAAGSARGVVAVGLVSAVLVAVLLPILFFRQPPIPRHATPPGPSPAAPNDRSVSTRAALLLPPLALATLLATSNPIWRFATTPELYAPFTLLLLLALSLLPQRSRRSAADSPLAPRRDLLAGYCAALACNTHVLALPSALLVSASRLLAAAHTPRRSPRRALSTLLRLAIGWLLGASLLLYLPLRAHLAPDAAWGVPARLHPFIDHLLARDFSRELAADTYRAAAGSAASWQLLGPELLLLALLGLLALAHRPTWNGRALSRLALAAAALAGALLAWRFGAGMVLDAYAIAAILPLTAAALLSAATLAASATRAPATGPHPAALWLPALGLLLFSAFRIQQRWPERDLHAFDDAHLFGEALARSAPDSAIIVLDNTLDYFALEEFRATTGSRPDLLVVYGPVLMRPWAQARIHRHLPEFPAPAAGPVVAATAAVSRAAPAGAPPLAALVSAATRARRPLLYAPLEQFALAPSSLQPWGLLFRLRAGDPVDNHRGEVAATVPAVAPAAASFAPTRDSADRFFRLAAHSRDPNTRRRAALIHANRARWAAATGDHHRAAAEWSAAVDFQPDDARFLYNLGAARDRSGDLAGAEQAWERAVAAHNPAAAVATRRARIALGRVQLQRGHPAAAAASLHAALEHGIDTFEVRVNLGAALLRLGRPARALPHLRAATAQRPGSAPAWRQLSVALQLLGDPTAAGQAAARADSLASHPAAP